jgi:hypothetical protein
VIVDYYLFNGRRFHVELLERLPAWNPLAVVAFVVGAAASFYPPSWIAAGLYALVVSMIVYATLYLLARLAGKRIGHAKAAGEAGMS